MAIRIAKIVNNISRVIGEFDKRTDLALSAMGVDILRLSKKQVPVAEKGGQLQSSGLLKKIDTKKYMIRYNKEYAAYQHRGHRRDGTHVVRNYTTPGTKSKYLEDPAREVFRKKTNYIDRYFRNFK